MKFSSSIIFFVSYCFGGAVSSEQEQPSVIQILPPEYTYCSQYIGDAARLCEMLSNQCRGSLPDSVCFDWVQSVDFTDDRLFPCFCTSWFDGCNTCGVDNGVITFCTRRYCFGMTGKPRCLAFDEGQVELEFDRNHLFYDRFEGTGFENECKDSDNCFVSGCSSEICAAEIGFSTCEGLPVLPTGSCVCVYNECVWAKGDCEDPVDPCSLVRCAQCTKCHNGACIPDSSQNGNSCNDGNPDTLIDVCQDGDCVGQDPCTIEAEYLDWDENDWSLFSGSVLHNGQGLESDHVQATLEFSFLGDILIIYYAVGPNRGEMSVVVDGGSPVIINCTHSEHLKQIPYVVAPSLAQGMHNVVITCTEHICAPDYFDTCKACIIEAEDLDWDEDEWGLFIGSVLHNGQGLESDHAEAMLEFTFVGDLLVIYYAVGPNRGEMSVVVDGGAPVIINCTHSAHLKQIPHVVAPYLTQGIHNVVITCTDHICAPDYFDTCKDCCRKESFNMPCLETNPSWANLPNYYEGALCYFTDTWCCPEDHCVDPHSHGAGRICYEEGLPCDNCVRSRQAIQLCPNERDFYGPSGECFYDENSECVEGWKACPCGGNFNDQCPTGQVCTYPDGNTCRGCQGVCQFADKA